MCRRIIQRLLGASLASLAVCASAHWWQATDRICVMLVCYLSVMTGGSGAQAQAQAMSSSGGWGGEQLVTCYIVTLT